MKIKYFVYWDEKTLVFQNSYLREDLISTESTPRLDGDLFRSGTYTQIENHRLYLNGNDVSKRYCFDIEKTLPKRYDFFKAIEAIDKYNLEE